MNMVWYGSLQAYDMVRYCVV